MQSELSGKKMRFVLFALMLVGCGEDPPNDKLSEELSGCDPIDPALCTLPWPSSYFQVEADTPSGVQNSFWADSLPMNRDGVQLRPDAWNELDGFSLLTPLLAYFDDLSAEGLVGHEDLEAYAAGDVTTVIVDTVTGERVPHFAEIDATGDEDAEALLILRPVVPMEYATRYVVGIRGLKTNAGSPVAVSDGFAALRDGKASQTWDIEGRRDHFDGVVFPTLEAAGFARSELQLAWDFVTISRESSLGPALFMRDDALERVGTAGPAYTIDHDRTEEGDCSVEGTHIARTFYGNLQSPMYTDVDAPGAILTRDESGMPFYNGEADVEFMVRIPCSLAEDPQDGGMILQYGHGLLGDLGEARGSYLAQMAHDNRWVLLAQNWTGMAEMDRGGITLMLAADVSDFRMLPERTLQGFIEKAMGLRMMTGDLASDDIVTYDGKSVIDPTRFGYYGNSQGAILGGAYVGLSSDIERAVLGVGGMPYSILLSRSSDFDPFFLIFAQKYLDNREITLILAAIQTLWDPAESSGYVHVMNRDPLPGSPAKDVLIQTAIGDSQVTYLGAHISARAWGASTIAPETRPVWGLEEQVPPFTGSAFVEWDYPDGRTCRAEPAAGLE